MAYTRNGRSRTSAQRQPSRPATPPPADNYTLLVGGLVSCRRCATLLPDTRPAREQHDSFHQSLRKMWDALGGRS
jgi:hypothetical protein